MSNREEIVIRDKSSGKILASIRVFPIQSDCFAMTRLEFKQESSEFNTGSIAKDLIFNALKKVKKKGAKRVHLRLIKNEVFSRLYDALSAIGFKILHERIEFKIDVSDLPTDEGSPFVWKQMNSSDKWTIEKIAPLLEKAGSGDPDWDPEDNPLELLKSYLSDPELNGDNECVQVGLLEKKPAAVIVAQVNPSTGWSRITYMGILPPFRGKGLGKWVHRHGFEMMKQQKGKSYIGGTVISNKRMVALFKAHRCKEFQRLVELVYKL